MVALACIGLAFSLYVAVSVVLTIRGVPLVSELDPPTPSVWPKVSVIVPACNEEESIESAMRSRIQEGYPNVEYILVDDRSSDRTGAIIDMLAAEDSRIRAIHVTTLPDGWLGKVHAMQRGLDGATGEYILLSDADVHHEPGALARIVAECERRGLDHVALFPSLWTSTFWFDVMQNSMLDVLALGARAWAVSDPKSSAAVGGGTFGLVRRSALERAGGLESVKLEVADDVGLGIRLKRTGAKPAVFNARGLVGLHFYRSIGEAVRGVEKNSFAIMGRYSLVRFLLVFGVLSTLVFAPYIALFGATTAKVIALATIALSIVMQMVLMRWCARPALPSLFLPIGMLLNLYATFRSMVLTLKRGGIVWRGTRYSLATLRRGMSFTLGF